MAQPDERHHAVERAIEQAKANLLARQQADGSWAGDIIMASRQTAYYVIVSNYVGYFDQPYYDQTLAWLMNNQSAEGTWGQMVPAEPASLSNTAAAVLALELTGISRNDPRLVSARDYIMYHGGIHALDPLLQAMYAVYGRIDWDAPALVQFDVSVLLAPLTPDGFPASLRHRPPWWREGFVAVAALRALHRRKTLSLIERQGLHAVEEWLLAHQLPDGSWFAAFPTLFAIMALHDFDPVRYRPQIEDGFRFLRSLKSPNGYQRPFELSVWDTSNAIHALLTAGQPACDLVFQPSISWLVAAQSPGGLKLSESAPGGWSYNVHNLIYPDNDDTSLALVAMSRLVGRTAHLEYRRRGAVQRAKEWIFYMQGGDGGWATFLKDDDKDNDSKLPSGIEDPSIPDVTGHVLSALGALGYRATDDRIRQAIAYLQRSQTEQGSWYGRWGLSYLYGTSAVLVGLHDVGADMQAPFIRKAVNWLISQENSDGGWGEVFAAWDQSQGISYTKLSKTSTAEQTAWVLMALLAAGQPTTDQAITRGVDYLLTRQKLEGDWPGGAYTVLGIDPYTNSLYSIYWPLLALGEYRQAASTTKPDGHENCTTYIAAHQSLPTPVLSGEIIGGPANLSFYLTAEDLNHVRLWIENKSHYEIRQLTLSLAPDRASPSSAQTWSAKSLEAGTRLSWRVSIAYDISNIWNIQLSYVDATGRPFWLTRSLPLEGNSNLSSQSRGVNWIVWVLPLVGSGLAAAVSLVRYRPLLALGFRNLRRHRLRTVLTSTGVVLGTAAIGATLTLSLAFRTKLVQDFATFGTNRIIVLPYQLEIKFGPPPNNLRTQPRARFNDNDVTAIKALAQVTGVSPFVQEDLSVARAEQSLQMTIRFVDPKTYPDVAASHVERGRFLYKGDQREVVLGYAVAQNAFDSPIQVGDQLRIDGHEFAVVGIMAEVGGIRGRIETIVSPDIVLYAPLDKATEFTGRNYYDGIEIRSEAASATENVAQQVGEVIRRNHVSTELSVISSHRLLRQVENLLVQFTAIITVISLLTLMVSGIGVANMMLVSVRERTEEIGIMKALGAGDRIVLIIFLVEAAYIGLFSALAGSGLGYMLLLLLQQIAGIDVLPVAPYLLVFSLLFSLLITVGCGSYPAYVAARLEPAEAIRQG
jgi:squalene-hopene/tetraprenyl-beta-curcumene cyclase